MGEVYVIQTIQMGTVAQILSCDYTDCSDKHCGRQNQSIKTFSVNSVKQVGAKHYETVACWIIDYLIVSLNITDDLVRM